MENLKDRLSRYRQIKLSVIGRKSGKTISNPGLPIRSAFIRVSLRLISSPASRPPGG